MQLYYLFLQPCGQSIAPCLAALTTEDVTSRAEVGARVPTTVDLMHSQLSAKSHEPVHAAFDVMLLKMQNTVVQEIAFPKPPARLTSADLQIHLPGFRLDNDQLPFPEHHFAVFIIYSWNLEMFWSSLQTYMAAGWGKRVIIIDNSPDRHIVHDAGQ